MDAKNGLEHQIFSFKGAVNDEKNAGKLTDAEKTDALSKVSDVETWLSSNQNATKEDIQQRGTEFSQSVSAYASKLGVPTQGAEGAAPGSDD